MQIDTNRSICIRFFQEHQRVFEFEIEIEDSTQNEPQNRKHNRKAKEK